MMVPKVIYLMGIDGSGKTTVVEWLERTLKEEGYEVCTYWLRFNHSLSKPLLAFCRLVGLTRYEHIEEIRVGYHEFYRSRSISWLYVFFQYLDALRVMQFKVKPSLRKRNTVVILDRYVYDIIVDLEIDTGIKNLDCSFWGRALIRLLPKNTFVLPISRCRDALLMARPESQVDKNFENRLKLYSEVVIRQNLICVKNDSTLDELLCEISIRTGLM